MIILSVGIFGFVGCASNVEVNNGKVDSEIEMKENKGDAIAYKLFENGSATNITDSDKIGKFDDIAKSIFKGEVQQAKSYITKDDIEKLKNKTMIEMTYKDTKSISIGEKEIKFSTLYLYDEDEEGDKYSFIVKDIEKGFEGKEDIFHHLGTNVDYKKN